MSHTIQVQHERVAYCLFEEMINTQLPRAKQDNPKPVITNEPMDKYIALLTVPLSGPRSVRHMYLSKTHAPFTDTCAFYRHLYLLQAPVHFADTRIFYRHLHLSQAPGYDTYGTWYV